MLWNLLASAFDNLSFLNTLLGLIIGWIVYRWASRRWLNLPPGPLGLPIIGSIPFLGSHAEKTFFSWSKTYGPVMTVDFARTRFVVLNNYDVIEEVRSFGSAWM